MILTQDFAFGRTCQGFSIPKTTPLDVCLPDWLAQIPPSFHQNNSSEFGEAIASSGATQVWLLDAKELQRGESSIVNISESPRGGGVSSSLAAVLEISTPEKYYLSRKACEGILNRAQKRSQTLPPILEKALIDQCAKHDTSLCLNLTQDVRDLIAFSCKDSGQDAGILSPTLRSMNFSSSHINGGGQVAIAYNVTMCDSNGTRKDRPFGGLYINQTDCANTITSSGSGIETSIIESTKDNSSCSYTIRKLTPTEVERLQGFEPGYTAIPYRGRIAADANRYRAIGNSFAVPVVRWLGERIKNLLHTENIRC